MEVYILLGDYFQYSDFSQSAGYYNNSYELAKSRKDIYEMGRAASGLGNAYYNTNKYDTAVYYYQLADSLYHQDGSPVAIESAATTKAALANVELVHNNYERALKAYFDAIKIMEPSTAPNKWKALGNLYASVGTVYNDMNQFDKALKYDLKGLNAHYKQEDDQALIAYMELYVAEDYLNLKKFNEAAFHLHRGKKLVEQVQSPDLSYKYFQDQGRYYFKKNRPDSAIVFYKQSLDFAEKSGRKFLIMDNFRMLGFAYRDMKDYRQAKAYMIKALSLTRELNNKKLEVELLKNLANTEASLHDNLHAVSYYQQYISLNDSLNEAGIYKKITEMEAKYQLTKKEDSILLLRTGNHLQQAELHKRKVENLALATGLILLVLMLILGYMNFKRKQLLAKQNAELNEKRIQDLEKERQLIAMQSVLKGQEEERSRLARDLHDGVGGLLSGVKLSLSTMKGNVFISEENAQSVTNVIRQLDQSIMELRRVSHNMMPEALIKFGLKEALENYCENLSLSGKVKVRFQAYGMEQRFEQSTEIVMYRILQELLSNVIRHAEAKNVLVQLIKEDNRFNVTVEDDGKGFNINDIEKKGGAGFANIRSRVEYLKGVMDIQSSPGNGTSVNIEGYCS